MHRKALTAATLALALLPAGASADLQEGDCVTLRSGEKSLVATESGYAMSADGRPARFAVKPTRPGHFLLHDERGGLPARAPGGRITRVLSPRAATQWRAARLPWWLEPAGGCLPFPEAELNATGRPFKGTRRDGSVRGFADAHVHVTADLRAGGRVIHGKAFDPLGIAEALGHDEDDHGPNGILDVTGNLLRDGNPVGTHDTDGWPTFSGWPTHDTNTHQQVYYVWLKRMWMAGLRIAVAQLIEDEPLCRLEPLRSHSCDETETIKLAATRMRELEAYVDAQHGGPGKGWLRIVTGPRQARRVIRRGKLAVVLGVESSNPFGCSELRRIPQCSREDIDAGIALYRSLGISSLFLTHWVDNAFGGVALEGGDKGLFISAFQVTQTGRFFDTGPCPEDGQGEEPQPALPEPLAPLAEALDPVASGNLPLYGPGRQCNPHGLTELGEYAVGRLLDEGFLIEADHLGEWARLRVLELAEARGRPLVSSHTGTGGPWTESTLRRLFALGGIATATPGQAQDWVDKIQALRAHRARGRLQGIAIGTDTGGFSSLPGPAAKGEPLAYPFRSFDGRVVFERQRTGERTFDLNADGVAHYGLYADMLADMARRPGGRDALRVLFRSAEAYLRMWETARAGGRVP